MTFHDRDIKSQVSDLNQDRVIERNLKGEVLVRRMMGFLVKADKPWGSLEYALQDFVIDYYDKQRSKAQSS